MNMLLDKATKQYQILTATRAELQKTRQYLESVIQSHNEVKVTARERQGTINDLNAQIQELNNTISELRSQINMLNDQITTLEGQIADLEAEKQMLQEEHDTLKVKFEQVMDENRKLQLRVSDLENENRILKNPGRNPDEEVKISTLPSIMIPVDAIPSPPGQKGSIVAVNEDLDYVIIDMDQQFVTEIMNATQTNQGNMLPQLTMLVLRNGEFVTKIRLRDIDKTGAEKLIIADIISEWQQQPIKPGDEVVYKKL
jgi:ABC-type transporter Mla subunit MlaD